MDQSAGVDLAHSQAIRPPEAIIPRRNGSESFSADSPPQYAADEDDDVSESGSAVLRLPSRQVTNDSTQVIPPDPDTGRVNNHGLEGLTTSSDGRYLFALVQGALQQEGGGKTQPHVPAP